MFLLVWKLTFMRDDHFLNLLSAVVYCIEQRLFHCFGSAMLKLFRGHPGKLAEEIKG